MFCLFGLKAKEMNDSTALSLLLCESKQKCIISFCQKLDSYISIGMFSGATTELSGSSGSGKTQLCMQIALNTQISSDLGGIEGRVVYIDTKQGVNPSRFTGMAFYWTRRCYNVLRNIPITSSSPLFMLYGMNTPLQNVSYVHARDYIEFVAALQKLKVMAELDQRIKSVLIDSFSFVFQNFDCCSKRTGAVFRALTDLQILANKLKIAVISNRIFATSGPLTFFFSKVVITSEITTRSSNEEIMVYPTLGTSYVHKIGQRIALTKNMERLALVDKGRRTSKGLVTFEIMHGGIAGSAQESKNRLAALKNIS